jgi:GcrA cell cycle regulator
MSWTDERVELLRRLWVEGLSASQIAAEIGTGITRNAVIGKVHRLGMSGRIKSAPTAMPRARERTEPIASPAPQTTIVVQGNTVLAAVAAPELAPRPIEKVVVPICQTVTMLELRETMCRWPLGDPSQPEFRFCGARSSGGLPYCESHRRLAYQPIHDRRRDRDRREARL